MILTALIGMVQSLLYNLIIFYLGKMLSDSNQFRHYLGLTTPHDDPSKYYRVTFWVEKLGRILTVIAIIGAVYTVYSTGFILFRAYV